MEPFWPQVISIAIALFLLIDSIGNVPFFLSVLKEVPPKRQQWVILREMAIALVIILLFQYLGDGLLDLLHISLPAIELSGGIILFLIALKMIFPVKTPANHDTVREKEPLIVPLAIPLIAGPAVLAAVMLYSGQHHPPAVLTTAILIAWGASTLILLSSAFLKKLLGPRGIIALERLMGLVLTLIAVEMFLGGLTLYLQRHAA